MTDLTLEEIRQRWPEACRSGLKWLENHWPADRASWTIPDALRAGCHTGHAIWLAVRLGTAHRRAVVLWAADCAERVLPIFERAHPGVDGPRKAIEAARSFTADAADARAAADAADTDTDTYTYTYTYAAAAKAAAYAAAAAAYAAAAEAYAVGYAVASAVVDAAAYAVEAAAHGAAERAWQRARLIERLEAVEPAHV